MVDELDSFRTNLRSWIAEVQAVDVTGEAERGRVVARCTGYGELRAILINHDFFTEATTRRLDERLAPRRRSTEVGMPPEPTP